jgi:hypothetical protein
MIRKVHNHRSDNLPKGVERGELSEIETSRLDHRRLSEMAKLTIRI